jgi:hypothetical protein
MAPSTSSKPGEVTLAWLGGEHPFRLATYGQLRLLQETCKAGPMEIFHRLIGARWYVDDVREVIRIGLIGGGMTAADAGALVKAAIDESAAWLEHVALAKTILLAGLARPDEGDEAKKQTAEKTKIGATDASSFPPSTEPAPRSE